jgi:hypothetical protein
MPGRKDYVRPSVHRFESHLVLAHAEKPHIHGFGQVYTSFTGEEVRTVFVTFDDDHDSAKATVTLTVEQAERTGRLLLELVERTRSTPAPDPATLRSASVESLTAWPPEGTDGE